MLPHLLDATPRGIYWEIENFRTETPPKNKGKGVNSEMLMFLPLKKSELGAC